MKLIRTFHNVGHGAFYTERFYNEDNNAIFTAVYDCGAFKLNSLENIIRNYFREGDTIDFLFISHFHSDHINGFNCLNQWCNIKHIVLPALSNAMAIESYVYNYINTSHKHCNANVFLKKAYQAYNGTTSTYNEGNTDTNETTYSFINELREGEENILDIAHINRPIGIINTGFIMTMIKNIDWVYIPFNIRNINFNNLTKDKIKQFIRQIKESTNNERIFRKIDSIITEEEGRKIDFEKLDEFLEDNIITMDKLRDLYEQIFGRNHNSYSMPVYSGHYQTNPNKKDKSSFDHNSWYRDNTFEDEYSACLYMGDFECTHNNNYNPVSNFSKLMNFYQKWFKYIYTIQVPHHGSEYNHTPYLYEHSIFNIISIHKDKYKLPAIDVIKDIVDMKGLPIIVTDKQDSKTTFTINNL